MELDLGGKTVLITGGSKGIGFAIAGAFAAEGCHLHLAARTLANLEAARGHDRKGHCVRDLAGHSQPVCGHLRVSMVEHGAAPIAVGKVE